MGEELSQSLYIKYRPVTLNEYKGDKIKGIVEKRFRDRSNMPHVILIHGNRGCGKTTFNRIISKYYLCSDPQEDGTPCEKCEMCESVNQILIGGESAQVECPGVVEIDATRANGKDAIVEIITEAMEPPIYSTFKIVIFDECHMLTKDAQNALLISIEDVPKHLVVIFATTDPQKVLPTIKSRCQLTLEVRKQSVQSMASRLMEISKAERFTVSEEALEAIARKGGRVPRECINLLEGVAKTYSGKVTLDNVKEYVSDISSEYYIEYFKSSNSSLEDILLFVRKLRDNDVKLSDFVSGLLEFTLDSMYIKHGISLEEYPLDYIKTVKDLFTIYTSNDFDILLQILEYLSNQLTSEDDAKNEVLLTTTAMRISKISLLANGLANEQSEAITENKISLLEHSKKLKISPDQALDKLKVEMSIRDINDGFDDVRQVIDTNFLLSNVTLPEVEIKDEDVETKNTKEDLGSQVDNFFDI